MSYIQPPIPADQYAPSGPPAWGQPGYQAPGRPNRLWVIPILVAVVILIAILGANGHSSTTSGGGSFSVAAGWTVDRAANLSVKIRTDDGASSSTADCAMKTIAYVNTWLEWQAMGATGQLVAIRAAEAGC